MIVGLIGVEVLVMFVDTYWNELRVFVERFDASECNFVFFEVIVWLIFVVNVKLVFLSWFIKCFVNFIVFFSGGGMVRCGADFAAFLRIYFAFNRVEDVV